MTGRLLWRLVSSGHLAELPVSEDGMLLMTTTWSSRQDRLQPLHITATTSDRPRLTKSTKTEKLKREQDNDTDLQI
jgi:hypothetical protein